MITFPKKQAVKDAIVVSVALLAVGLAAGFYESGLLNFLELDTIDARFAVRGTSHPPRRLVFVAIDETALAKLPDVVGTFIPRSIHARVIRLIARDHPAVVAYDYTFDNPSPAIIKNGGSEDNQLLEAIRNAHGKVVVASDLTLDGGPFAFGGGTGLLHELHAHAGSTILPRQSTIRRFAYAIDGVKSFAVVAAEVASGKTITKATMGGDAAWIDFYGPPGTVRTVPFLEVYEGKLPQGFFTDDVVVVGASAPSLLDLHPTSTSGNGLMAGPEINANAIETALRGFPLRSTSEPLDLGLIVLLGLVVPIVNLRFKLRVALAAALTGAGVYLTAAQAAFDHGWIISLSYPLVALAGSAVIVLASRYVLATRDPRFVRIEAVGLVIGSDVAGFRIERLLGRGGGGSVYLASEVSSRRRVALKILNPSLADSDDFRRRFVQEAEIARSLEHAHVVPIYQAGEESGYLFIAMKYVRGSLAALLRREERLPVARTIGIVEQVAQALDMAHGRGLVHRDLTPSNILLEPPSAGRDHAYLADFGLTKSHGAISATGFVGKPDYVAPELIRGDPIDGRSDLYSLGCVVYECLTGTPPFADVSEIAVIGGHLGRTPAPPSNHRPDITPQMDAVVAQALSKEPEERYSTCGEFVQALRATQPMSTTPTPVA